MPESPAYLVTILVLAPVAAEPFPRDLACRRHRRAQGPQEPPLWRFLGGKHAAEKHSNEVGMPTTRGMNQDDGFQE
jgi:hypothetical protein